MREGILGQFWFSWGWWGGEMVRMGYVRMFLWGLGGGGNKGGD